jgi:hypothetical protein
MTASAQNNTVSKQTVHLLHPDSAETTADHGNILLTPPMHAIIEARTKNKNKRKENRKDPRDKQGTNKNKNRGQTQSGHIEYRE